MRTALDPEPELPRHRLDLGEWAVDVRRTGSGPGRAIVLVHGIGVSGDYFLPFARVLARTHPVVLLDLPGYGRTPTPPRPLDIGHLADAAAAAMGQLAVADAVVVGQSMGCQTVTHLVANHPGAAAAYLLIGPTVDPAARSVLRQGGRLALDMVRETLADNLVVLRDYVRMGPVRYLRTTRYMLDDHIEATIARCPVPGLVVRGARDPIAPAAWVDQLARLAPDASAAQVPGAAHNVQHTHPEQLAAVCAPFLARVTAP